MQFAFPMRRGPGLFTRVMASRKYLRVLDRVSGRIVETIEVDDGSDWQEVIRKLENIETALPSPRPMLGAGQSIEINKMLLKDLSPADQLSGTRDWFEEVCESAKHGDPSAFDRVAEIAAIFRDASWNYSASGKGFWDDVEIIRKKCVELEIRVPDIPLRQSGPDNS